MSTDSRLDELEARYTHLQDEVDQLSQVLFQQQRTLDLLTQVLERLRDKVAADPGLVDAAANEKPPHY